MKVFVGSYYKCDSGIPTGEVDIHGKELFTGDIVQLLLKDLTGLEEGLWQTWDDRFTVIVADQYESYRDGTFTLLTDNPTLYTMGISSVGVQGNGWGVSLVKSHRDVVPGETVVSKYNFNFKE